ncbi:MAG: hypothetical protein JSW10_11715 [Pseudomonadota bacterium]|nr:MAG: hypothetical protein JSW10_11715 [Pseudomonadota bacterium]
MPLSLQVTRIPDVLLPIIAAMVCLWILVVSSGLSNAETREQRIEREIEEIEHYGGLGSIRHSDERSHGQAEQRRSSQAGERNSTSSGGERATRESGTRTTRESEARHEGRGHTERTSRSGYGYGSVKYESR